VVPLTLSRLVAWMLFDLHPHGPITCLGVCASVAAVALAACVVPVRRALAVDPTAALRCE